MWKIWRKKEIGEVKYGGGSSPEAFHIPSSNLPEVIQEGDPPIGKERGATTLVTPTTTVIAAEIKSLRILIKKAVFRNDYIISEYEETDRISICEQL